MEKWTEHDGQGSPFNDIDDPIVEIKTYGIGMHKGNASCWEWIWVDAENKYRDDCDILEYRILTEPKKDK